MKSMTQTALSNLMREKYKTNRPFAKVRELCNIA